jgi:hypothetical protein
MQVALRATLELPGKPVAPVAPVAPVNPVAPVLPATPTIPVGPEEPVHCVSMSAVFTACSVISRMKDIQKGRRVSI